MKRILIALLLFPVNVLAAPINLEITWDTSPYSGMTGTMRAGCTENNSGAAPLNGSIRITPDLDPGETFICQVMATAPDRENSQSVEVRYTRPLGLPTPNAVIRVAP